MRIISGTYKGRTIDGYNIDGTRPTMDRVKESLIAMIQNEIPNSTCLDLFTGSGSVGLELLSNGAKKCYFVDNNFKVIETLTKKIKKLNVKEEYQLIKGDFEKVLSRFKNENLKFDIIFLDPPYQNNYITKTIKLVKDYNLLNENGIIICEYENEKIDISDYTIIKEKRYGSKFVMILKNI